MKGLKNKKRRKKKQRRNDEMAADDAFGETFRNVIPAIDNLLR